MKEMYQNRIYFVAIVAQNYLVLIYFCFPSIYFFFREPPSTIIYNVNVSHDYGILTLPKG